MSRLRSTSYFNPRTPERGATLGLVEVGLKQFMISIHAPLSGVRRRHVLQQHGRQDFNPRTPERGATGDDD